MAEQEGAIDLNALQPAELNELADGLQSDLQLLSESAQKLQGAVARFHQSGVALEALEAEKPGASPKAAHAPAPVPPLLTLEAHPRSRDAGKPMLVPLTQSLYAPGTLGDTGKVLVDIGTGYFVEARPLSRRAVAAFGGAWPLTVLHTRHL
jgi:prefoldin subunit 5